MLIHHTILSASYTGGSSGLHHGIKFLVVSFFLASLAHHSFTGTRYRQNISPANDRYHSDGVLEDINLRSRYSLSDNDNDINEIDKGDRILSEQLSEQEPEQQDTFAESEPEKEELAHELSIEVSFEDTYKVLVFLGVVFSCGEIAAWLGIPSLVGQMIAGFLLGPPLLEYVPFPEAFVLLGDLGLIMLLIEAGIELDVGLVKEAGIRPILIAVAGTLLAFGTGLGISYGQGQTDIKSAIAAAACFAPTSLGVAANSLSMGKALNTPVGQLIVASAVIDDVIGLIILSMLNVLVEENPPLYAYFIPIISAVGYLIVLGIAAITLIPYVVTNYILPRFKPELQQYVALALLYLLVMAYLPMMYYSKASHLTGCFLAGLSFSQVEGVHHTWINEAGAIMEWLLRIFFSASIGFQVPIQMFGNSRVVAWGFAFYIAVLAKLPVGFFVPKYDEKLPEHYTFNPYIRDVTITSVAMTCRGEFSFIIAAFGIGEGLLDTELYSAIVFGVLLSAITSPIALTLVLRHYNRLAAKYLEQEQLETSMRKGRVPLHLNIQIRSGVVPGMQTSIKNCCNSLGLFVIDQRSWQPRGRLGVVVATELYVVDGKTTVDVTKSFKRVSDMNVKLSDVQSLLASSEEEFEEQQVNSEDEQTKVAFEGGEPTIISEPIHDPISERCEEIRQALLTHPDLVNANVKVLQWVPRAKVSQDISEEITCALKNKETIDTLVDETPKHIREPRSRMHSGPVTFEEAEKEVEEVILEPLSPLDEARPSVEPEGGLRRRPRRMRTVSTPITGGADLWQTDSQAQQAANQGAPSPPVQYDVQSGIRYGVNRRQKMPSDLGVIAENTPRIEERLGGYVRHSLTKTKTPIDSPFAVNRETI